MNSRPDKGFGHGRQKSCGAITKDDFDARALTAKSCPGSPTGTHKSPGLALVSVAAMYLNEDEEISSIHGDEPSIVRRLGLGLDAESNANASSVSTVASTRQSVAPATAARAMRVAVPAQRKALEPPQRPQQQQQQQQQQTHVVPKISDVPQKPQLTVPIAGVPSYMRPTAATKRRVEDAKSENVKPAVVSRTTTSTTTAVTRPKTSTYSSSNNNNNHNYNAKISNKTVHTNSNTAAVAPRRSQPAPQPKQQQQQQPARVNKQPAGFEVTVPATPQWVRNARARERPKVQETTEEMELRRLREHRRQVEEQRRLNFQRLRNMQQTAQYESRFQRTTSTFTPNGKSKSGSSNNNNKSRVESRPLQNAQPQQQQAKPRPLFESSKPAHQSAKPEQQQQSKPIENRRPLTVTEPKPFSFATDRRLRSK